MSFDSTSVFVALSSVFIGMLAMYAYVSCMGTVQSYERKLESLEEFAASATSKLDTITDHVANMMKLDSTAANNSQALVNYFNEKEQQLRGTQSSEGQPQQAQAQAQAPQQQRTFASSNPPPAQRRAASTVTKPVPAAAAPADNIAQQD